MTPVKFKESNCTLHGPVEPLPNPIGKIEPLHVWVADGMVVSCWRPTLRERLSILFFGRVWLNVLGSRTQPPVSLTGCREYFLSVGPDPGGEG